MICLLINMFDAEAHLDTRRTTSTFLEGVPLIAELDETLDTLNGLDRFAARKKIVERLEAAGLLDKIEPTSPCRAARRSLRRGLEPYLTDQWYVDAKTLAQACHRGGARAQDCVCAGAMGGDILQLDGEYPAVVHFAANLVGPSDSGVVRAGRQNLRRRERKTMRWPTRWRTTPKIEEITGEDGHDIAADPEWRVALCGTKYLHLARRGRARHLVLLGTVAILDTRLAGRDAGAQALLSDLNTGHWLRHHLLLGRTHDDDGAALHERGAIPRRLHPPLVRDASGAKMSKSKGNVIDPLA